MASNKFYAVRKGRTVGIHTSWEDCKKSVDGFPGAEYKSFARIEDAESYINGEKLNAEKEIKGFAAYVDGSYDAAKKKYSGAAVIIKDGVTVAELSRSAGDEQAQLRNVAGEIIGAKLAIDYCINNSIQEITIFHDYQGIGKWGNAEWKANLPMTQEYREYVRQARNSVNIHFSKVPAHSGVKYNERADYIAKKALENDA